MSREQTHKSRRKFWRLLAAGLGICLGVAAVLFWQSRSPEPVDPSDTAQTRSGDTSATAPVLRFTDVTAAAGIDFTHAAGANGQRWYPETMGSGVAFFDYDGDTWPDILLVNSGTWPRQLSPPNPPSTPALKLYRNRGDGTFEEVTQAAGMAAPLYGMGVAVADYDNDGDRDVFVSGYLQHLFFINNGDGTFTESVEHVGIQGGTWGAGAAFVDYDRDGWLDLVLSSYVEWTPELERDLDCTYGTPQKDYCPVHFFNGQGLTLYRNQGDGRFRDVTAEAGVASEGTRAFAPAILDYNEDGWPDILVASDGTPSLLWRNLGNGAFEEVGVRTGIVLDESGAAYAGMGIDVAYPHNDGQLCIAIGNFVGEPTTLHCRVRQGEQTFHPELYAEMSARTGIGRATLRSVTFGLFFFDADLDGWQDLFMVNGHVVDEARLRNAPRAQRPQLFRNLGTGSFQEVSVPPGSALDRPLVGRGAAHADYDGDGDVDIVVSQNQGPAVLWRNDTPNPGHYLRVQLTGTQSNRDAIGAAVRVHTATRMLRQTVRTGVSYLSQSSFPLAFGLGQESQAVRVEITWPSGKVEVYPEVAADTTLHAIEGRRPTPAPEKPVPQPAEVAAPAAREDPYLAYIHTAMTAYQEKRYTEAAQAFEAAAPLRPDEPVPYRYLADLYWRQDQQEQALQTVQRLAQVRPDAYFLDRQGNGYEDSGLLGLAQLLYAEAVRIDPAFPSARFNLGRTYLEQGRVDEGIVEVQEAVRLYPTFAEAHETLGLAYMERGQWAEAVTHLEQALNLKPALASGRNHLGRLYLAQGQFEAAIATFQKLVEQHPEAVEARHNLAVAYARHGNQEEALSQFRAVIRQQPDFHAARFDLSALALEMRRPQVAIEALQPLLTPSDAGPQPDAEVDRAEVRYRLGLAYMMAGQLPQAIHLLQDVLHEQPDRAEAHVYLGSLYYRQGQFEPAWRHARQAERLGAPVAELIAALRQVAPEPKSER
jgi:tetratricopeptide (TPR) repeat protein